MPYNFELFSHVYLIISFLISLLCYFFKLLCSCYLQTGDNCILILFLFFFYLSFHSFQINLTLCCYLVPINPLHNFFAVSNITTNNIILAYVMWTWLKSFSFFLLLITLSVQTYLQNIGLTGCKQLEDTKFRLQLGQASTF